MTLHKGYGTCPKHRKSYEFYDTETCKAKCSECLISGDLNGGDNDKQLLRIEEAYSNAAAEANDDDISLKEKKKKIQEKLKLIMDKIKGI